MNQLTLEVVGPRGRLLHAEHLDSISVRRREPERDTGSGVVLLRGHGPLLMQMQPCEVVYMGPQGERRFRSSGGLLEVWESTVTIAQM